MLAYLKEADWKRIPLLFIARIKDSILESMDGSTSDGSMRSPSDTPLLIRWPGVIKAGSRNGDIVSPIDFAGTFYEIAGIDAQADLHGRSMASILKGKTPKDWRKSFYYHYYEYPGWHYVRAPLRCSGRQL